MGEIDNKKTLSFLLLALTITVFVLALIACTKGNNNKSISDLVAHLKASGVPVGQQSTKQYAFIGAVDGCGLEIGGQEVEIYKFDTNDSSQRKILDKVKKEGTFTVMGFTVPAKVNGSFLILNYQDNPNIDALLKAFSKF